jgi:hypothetical protein
VAKASITSHIIEGGLVFGGSPPGAALCFRGRRTSTDSEEGIGAGNGTRTRDPLLGKAWVDYPLRRPLSESGDAPFANRSRWSPNCQSTLLYPYCRLIQSNSLANQAPDGDGTRARRAFQFVGGLYPVVAGGRAGRSQAIRHARPPYGTPLNGVQEVVGSNPTAPTIVESGGRFRGQQPTASHAEGWKRCGTLRK